MWGLAKVKGSFKAAEGTGTVTEDGEVHGTLMIDATSVDTGNKKRDTHLRSADFLESDAFPTFVYTVTGAQPAGDDKVNVTGTLGVHGETRPLDIVVTVVRSGPTVAVLSSEFAIDRSEWGLSWAKMGAKLINEMVVSARFTKS